ncbi:hypothetical protein TSA6c_17405 [Azospirillum sp. TSA6c]|uniref:hypothetical protein n=1 Tax=Azospirillum sp. TSA6c TaxID=709813 RepID=UPI000D60B388|nr:hypothetical protein [Azospirillum sp. TSA6c]PWC48198.1 hypothetical protein TSA6c_17405 [Azospirillum sp. TSA6c]
MPLGAAAANAAAYPRLPEQIDIAFGPRDLLARFFLLADRMARDRGILLSISRDFGELLTVNEQNRASWDELFPAVDHRFHRLQPDAAFWLRGVDGAGRIVLTRACRRIDLGTDTLQEGLTSLRLLYDPAIGGDAPDELLFCDCPLASVVTGATSFQAGGWHHPEFRGRGLSAIASRVIKALGLSMWGIRQWVSLVDDDLAPGLSRAYGVTCAEPGVEWRRFGVSRRMHLFHMDEGQHLDDLTTFTLKHDAVPAAADAP